MCIKNKTLVSMNVMGEQECFTVAGNVKMILYPKWQSSLL